MKTIYTALVTGLLTVAVARADDGFAAPDLEAGLDWRAWLFSLVFLAGVAVLAFRNARRTQVG